MFDANKFAEQLKEAALDKAREQALKSSYDVKCPECHESFKAHSGKNTCPHCGKVVNITFDINF